MTATLTRTAWPALLALALVKLGVHLATSDGYGYFRDELYYIASTDHLAWGYVEHPPLSIALLWLSRALLGDSLLAIRFLPAVAGAATVLMTGLLARELGGGTRAQVLAALATLLTPFYLAIAHFYSMNVFDVLAWATLAWLAARILRHGDGKLWLAFGAVAGFGLMNKISVGFLGAGLVAGMLLTPQRHWLTSRWMWSGGAIAVAIFLPHLVWQGLSGWPTLEFQANARAGKNVELSAIEYGVQQIMLGNPILLPLWLTGLVGLITSRRLQAVRALGFVYPLLFVLFVLTTAKSYYLAPLYTLLFAAGAVVVEPLLARAAWRTPVAVACMLVGSAAAIPIALPVLSPDAVVAYSQRIGLEAPAMERHEKPALPQSFADMHGWEELVDTVERVAATLTPAERARASVLAVNYGEAGALEVLGAERDLPPVVCGHNAYWGWRPTTLDEPVIALGRSREELERWFEQVEYVDTVRCRWCMPYQNESLVHVARGLKVPLDQFWREIKRYQ